MECKKTTIAATPGPGAVSYLSVSFQTGSMLPRPDEFLAKIGTVTSSLVS